MIASHVFAQVMSVDRFTGNRVFFREPGAQVDEPAALAAERTPFRLRAPVHEFSTLWAWFLHRYSVMRSSELADHQAEVDIVVKLAWSFGGIVLAHEAYSEAVLAAADLSKGVEISGDNHSQHLHTSRRIE